MSLSAERCEEIVHRTLAEVRQRFEAALADRSEGGNRLVAFETELRVDQVRRLVTWSADAAIWSERDGKRFISTATPLGQAALALIVNGGAVTAEQFFCVFCDTVAERRLRAMDVAPFVNLAVVEPCLYPERALAIYVTVAQLLATDRGGEHVESALPPLSSAYDLLHEELPANGWRLERLRPGAGPALPRSWPEHEMALLAAVSPALAPAIAGAGSDEARERLFAAHAAELGAYVREHLYGRVAAAVEAAGDNYAELSPRSED